LHPFGRIPALRDGEAAVWETSAILKYVDESFDGPLTLTPARISDRVVCEQWVSAVNSYLYDTIRPSAHGSSGPSRVQKWAHFVGPAALSPGDPSVDLFVTPILAYVDDTTPSHEGMKGRQR